MRSPFARSRKTPRDEGGGAAREKGGGAKRCGDARPSSGRTTAIVPASALSSAGRFLTKSRNPAQGSPAASVYLEEGLLQPRVEPASRREAPGHRLPSGCKRRLRSRLARPNAQAKPLSVG